MGRFNTSGPEIDYFRRYAEDQPALDLACGTGRLLLPYLRDGLDVDGCDVSADMIALCPEAAEQGRGSSRACTSSRSTSSTCRGRYRTVFMCGALGVGSTRAEDQEALRRVHDHLEPGGTFVLDNEVPYADGADWECWLPDARATLPRPRRKPGKRRIGSDGAEYELRSRLLDVDPLERQIRMEMQAFMWRDGELIAEDQHLLTMTLYFKDEIVLMLERAGFVDVTVRAALTDAEPSAADDFLVYTAHKPAELPSAGGRG